MQLQRTTSKHGHTGFEDLKNFIKEGSDFAKQIVEIIQVQKLSETHLHFSQASFLLMSW